MGALPMAIRLADFAIEIGIIDAYRIETKANGKYQILGYKDGKSLDAPLWEQLH